jgi:serine/threonine protein kinase/formylglycine-generating enzyme required for sulfatase activity
MDESRESGDIKGPGGEDAIPVPPGGESTGPPRFVDRFMDSVLPDEHPRWVGPYRILEILGEGGMGIVYLAEQTEPVRRRVALKLIKLGMDTREVVARFETESGALALMDHPNIAKVYDAGVAGDGRPFFVMEYVKGVPVTRYCDKNRLTVSERLELFVQVCHGVQHAHHRGVIHRDLKPTNILVESSAEEPTVKIIDFGVAKAINQRLTEKTVYTELGRVVGTPAYMSPEQAEMSSEDVDSRSDVYSLGVVLYELLVGVPPFDPESLEKIGYDEMLRRIREDDPLPPSTRLGRLGDTSAVVAQNRKTRALALSREIRRDLDWIALKALEKDRTRRYPTASEFAADIRRHLDLEPVLARPPSASYRVSRYIRRHRIGVGATAGALALILVMGVAAWITARSLHREEILSRSRQALAAGRSDWGEYLKVKERVEATEARRQKLQDDTESWAPVWERGGELEVRDELERLRRELQRSSARAERSFWNAAEIAPDGSEEERGALRALEDVYWGRFREVQVEGAVELREDHYRVQLEELGLRTYDDRLRRGKVALRSEPAGAEVFCFRYERREERLVPLPFDSEVGKVDPEKGLLRGAPRLEVEKVYDPACCPFRDGDRIAAIGGRPVTSQGELARAVGEVEPGTAVAVTVERDGGAADLSWVPFGKDVPAPPEGFPPKGRIVHLYHQLRFTLAGYPLEYADRCRIGTTGDAPIEVELPRGSYLFVLRKEGFADARFPVLVTAGTDLDERVRLLPAGKVPRSFVPIPEGPVAYGGDPGAFQSLRRGETRLPGFFISRNEVTTGEYLEFVNAPDVFVRIDKDGYAEPRSEAVRDALKDRDKDRVQLIPRIVQSGKPFWSRKGDRWELPGNWPARRPILGVSQHAAMEYAHWRTGKERGPYRYRLPSDVEWEKAARGVDRRIHVWGDYLVWSFCWCPEGFPQRLPPDDVGVSPLDESVFGVRDLAGSVSEHTSGRPRKGTINTSLRGGHWLSIDEECFRIATRNSGEPWIGTNATGFRLAADLPAD